MHDLLQRPKKKHLHLKKADKQGNKSSMTSVWHVEPHCFRWKTGILRKTFNFNALLARGGLNWAGMVDFHGKLLLTVATSTVRRIHLVWDISYSLPYSYQTFIFQPQCKHPVCTTRRSWPVVLTWYWQGKERKRERKALPLQN